MRSVVSIIFVITLLLAAADSRADTYPRQPEIDVLHYVFRLTVEDTSDRIVGETTVTFRIVQPVRELLLDLTSAADGKGMTVSATTVSGAASAFTHASDRLRLPLPATVKAGDELQAVITYSGIPGNGLRLIKNIYGERTMCG